MSEGLDKIINTARIEVYITDAAIKSCIELTGISFNFACVGRTEKEVIMSYICSYMKETPKMSDTIRKDDITEDSFNNYGTFVSELKDYLTKRIEWLKGVKS
jgi:hypothetical protein